ncbi:TATA-binding protein interacting [Sodiomyces alkalinus F11]|uniref:TATA-binding protein interacting n=1 Tax=Sodiomyces alkalinus (strain CBS 110278 / VKM F-3762 / F11) TaxID=1314773 RepID=A0A3N2PWV0_SODAK|nr:TATA-binding protein interacting [Sodiomyces alkalinus F11]ROT38987.1 TATA-binding protein interacting [Sodiomyces alkalinus F11]
MASSTPNPTPQMVMQLLNKLSEADPDYRFMGLNDLIAILERAKPDFLHHDYNVAARTVDSVIKTLDDQNGEVQNLAVKCLGPLVIKLPPAVIAPMLEKLSSIKLKNSIDGAVPSLALRTAIMSLARPIPGVPPSRDTQEAYSAVSRVLIPRLLGPGDKIQPPPSKVPLPPIPEGLLQNDKDLSPEAVDVLVEVVRCFGIMLSPLEVEAMLDSVMNILEKDRGSSAVKKRAVVAVSILAPHLSDSLLAQLTQGMVNGLSRPDIRPVSRRLYISILGSVARSIPHRFGPHLPALAPFVFQALGEAELAKHLEEVSGGEDLGFEYNDVREASLIALEAFLSSCPTEMEPFTDETIQACLRFLKYDPNLAVDEEEDEDMEDDEEDDEDEDDAVDFGGDYDDDDDDDDDSSWKVRRCAAKALRTLISTRAHGELLYSGILYSRAGPALVKKFDEREENVRLEVISCLSLLVRKTGEDLYPGSVDWNLEGQEDDVSYKLPISRKRRRQSSVAEPGAISPTLERAPATGPRADLARLTPGVIKASLKHLKTKAIPTKQAILNLLDDIVKVQRGGLNDYLNDIVGPVIESVKSVDASGYASSVTATGGNASATPSTLRMTALRLVSSIAKTHPCNILQPHLPQIVAAVTTAVNHRFYKISCEAIRTVEEIVKNITPPRSRLNTQKFRGELQKLFDTVVERTTQTQADAEVRQRSIHALGVLVARTISAEGGELISAEKRKVALDLLLDRIRNETTRLAAVRAVDNVALFCTSADQLESEWIRPIALELATQLRKFDRGIRTSSVQALKHLLASPAAKGKLDPDTIRAAVLAIDTLISNQDTHSLGSALLILAYLVEEDADLVVTPKMVNAVCELLKSTYAGILLDQLLTLVAKVGESGAGQPLMAGLLQSVSIEGDPSVVGKVIGALLVSSGGSAGVTIDSFVAELRTSAQKRDDARAILSLAVLGEAGLRLGESSPLGPDLFLSQFHSEPDKVSIAAAVALGRAGLGNVSRYLPVILGTMEKGGNTQYLAIQSIKEILQHMSGHSVDMSQFAGPLWRQLLTASTNPENTVACAECVGRLVIVDPKTYMPELKSLLKHSDPAIRGMAVQAVRYTLPDSDDGFDAMLRDALLEMLLTMLTDSEMDNRRLAMSTLNSAAHNKADLILPHLNQLMPIVLAESKVKPELVREVQMGPFKHKVDDGLEVRKLKLKNADFTSNTQSAYEMLYALMDTAYSRINKMELFDRVIAGLRDDNDIRSLCNLMLSKLVKIDPDETTRRLNGIAEAFRGVLSTKLKEGSVKQEVEKQEEANRSVLRVSLMLADRVANSKSGSGVQAGHSNQGRQDWDAYWEWAMKDYQPMLKRLREENEVNRRDGA